MTQCDLAFAYVELSKFVQCPGEAHLKAAERVLQYLRGTYDLGLTDGVCTEYERCPSFLESEASGLRDAELCLGRICSCQHVQAGGVPPSDASRIWIRATGSDSRLGGHTACIVIANNQVNREFTRHIDVRLYFVRDLVRDAVLTLVKCPGTLNVADALTKSLPSPSFLLHHPFLPKFKARDRSTRRITALLASRGSRLMLQRQPSQLTFDLPCQGERRQPTL
eukprot:1019133-Rhodomonas_salina.3